MTSKPEEYGLPEEEDHPFVEKLDWKSNSELSHKVLEQIQGDHSELFDEMAKQTETPSKHTQVSWVTQDPEKESEHGHQLDPDSTAGKIFLSFREAVKDVSENERWEPADALTEYLLRPVTEASSNMEFTNYDTKKEPAITLEESIPLRIRNLKYTVAGTLATYADNGFPEEIQKTPDFLKEIQKIQWISRDLEYLSASETATQDFNQRLLTENGELFSELKGNREANSHAPNHPSWLAEDRNESANDILDAFKESMEGRSPEYREMAASSIANTLAYSLKSETYDLEGKPSQRYEGLQFIEPRAYDEIMKESTDFFWRRTNDVENFISEAMLLEDQGAYQEAMHDLRDLKEQIEQATHNGYSPAQKESSGRNYDHDPEAREMLSHIGEADRERGTAFHNQLYEYTTTHILEQGTLEPDKWIEHPYFEEAFREYTAQMLPGDIERLVSNITERPEHSDPDALRERLNTLLRNEER